MKIVLSNSFMVIRINHKKEVMLLAFLLQLSKMLRDKLPRTLKQFEDVYAFEQFPIEEVKKFVRE
jgi:hypothetical protein